jgi:hypothetical protein
VGPRHDQHPIIGRAVCSGAALSTSDDLSETSIPFRRPAIACSLLG